MGIFDVEAVVFDLDGVLIDSRPLMEHVFRACYQQFGPGGEPPLAEFFSRMGMPLPDILRELGLPAEMAAKYREMSRQIYQQIRVVPGAHSALECMRDLGLPIGLMTGKDRARTLEILDYFCLRSFFSAVVCGDDPYPGKPSPDGLLALAQGFQVAPEKVVIIGDSLLDVQCGLAAGALTIAVTWGFEDPQRMANSGAHVCVSSFDELELWFSKCCSPLLFDVPLACQSIESE